MSDMNGDYTLNRNGLAKVERAARRWGSRWRNCFDTPTTHDGVDAVYERAAADRSALMPEWLESDEDYAAYQSECDFAFDLEAACDRAHERIDPNYYQNQQ